MNATEKKQPSSATHERTHRVWGYYDVLESGKGYKVKRICIECGKSISLQKHFHRSEHWVIVEGTARVICGDQEFIRSKNQSVYVPVEAIHRLENIGEIPLHIIEVQVGDLLVEEDIVRFTPPDPTDPSM